MAEGEERTISQFTIISKPPPKQRPLTAARIGFLPAWRRERAPKPEGGACLLEEFGEFWLLIFHSIGVSVTALICDWFRSRGEGQESERERNEEWRYLSDPHPRRIPFLDR